MKTFHMASAMLMIATATCGAYTSLQRSDLFTDFAHTKVESSKLVMRQAPPVLIEEQHRVLAIHKMDPYTDGWHDTHLDGAFRPVSPSAEIAA